jgi:hypothetical protein
VSEPREPRLEDQDGLCGEIRRGKNVWSTKEGTLNCKKYARNYSEIQAIRFVLQNCTDRVLVVE